MESPSDDKYITIADGLTYVDVNLMSLALRAASAEQAEEIISKAEKETGLDLSDANVFKTLTSEQIDLLQRFETVHRTQLNQLIVDRYDRDSVALKMAEEKDKNASFRRKLGASLLGFSCIFLCMIVWIPIPETQVRYVDYILGFLTGTIVTTVINYFYGGNATKAESSLSKNIPSPSSLTDNNKNKIL